MRRRSGTHRWAWMTVAAAIVTGMTGTALVVAHQGAAQSATVPRGQVASVAQSSWTPITTLTAPKWGRRVSAAGKLGPSVHLGSGFLPKVAVDPAGAGLVTWQSGQVASPYPTSIHGRRASATTGAFGPPIQFTGIGGYAVPAVDPAGVFGVIWVGGSVGSLVQARFGH
jgi:hypothetical protein